MWLKKFAEITLYSMLPYGLTLLSNDLMNSIPNNTVEYLKTATAYTIEKWHCSELNVSEKPFVFIYVMILLFYVVTIFSGILDVRSVEVKPFKRLSNFPRYIFNYILLS